LADISDKIHKKLEQIVDDKKELKMIIDLLETEKSHGLESHNKPSPQVVKRQFELLLDQYFPFKEGSQNE